MMLSSVFAKTLWEQRRSLVGWAIGLVLLVAMYMAFYPTIRGNATYNELFDQMPESLRSLFSAAGTDIASGAGYLQTELLSFMGPMLILFYAISVGANSIAGEEERGSLDLLMTTPVSRSRVVLEKLSVMLLGVAALIIVLLLSVILEGRLVDLEVSLSGFASAMLQLGLLGVEFGSLALLISAATGKLVLSRAIPTLVALVAYLLNSLAPLVDWLKPIRSASPFYQYIGNDPIRNGLSAAAVGYGVVLVLLFAAAAVFLLRRRDIAV